jgi:hypothetical protein
VATLTYVYADSTAVLGPLATFAEPHCYDLCAEHSERLTAPRGWQIVRLSPPESGRRAPSTDDLEALAIAVREAARAPEPPPAPDPGSGRVVRQGDKPPRRGHLRSVDDADGSAFTANR